MWAVHVRSSAEAISSAAAALSGASARCLASAVRSARSPTRGRGASLPGKKSKLRSADASSNVSLASIAARFGMPVRRPSLQRIPSAEHAVEERGEAPRLARLRPPRLISSRGAAGGSGSALGAAAESPARLMEHVRARTSVTDLLALFMNHRSSFDTLSGGTLLARLAAVRAGRPEEDALLRAPGAPFALLLSDLTFRIAREVTHDVRVLSSLAYAAGKLADGLKGIVRGEAGGAPHPALLADLAALLFDRVRPLASSAPPRSLAMLAWAGPRLGMRDGAFYSNLWEATRGGVCGGWPKWIAPPPPGQRMPPRTAAVDAAASPFEPIDLALLIAGFAAAGSAAATPAVYNGLAAWVLDASAYMPHAALASVIASYGSFLGPSSGRTLRALPKTDSAEAEKDARLRTLFALAEEVSVRCIIARIAAERAAGESVVPGDGSGVVTTGPRSMPLPPTLAVAMLRSLLSAGLQPTSVLAPLVRLLSVRAGPSTRIVSSLPPEALADAGWCIARGQYEDAYTPVLWSAIRRAVEIAGGSGTALPGRLGPGTRPSHLSTLAWALASASVPARTAVGGILDAAAARPAAFSVPALTVLAWAGAMQGSLTPARLGPMLEHVVDVAGEKAAGTRERAAGKDAPPVRPGDPDIHAGELLLSRPTAPGVARMQAQLRMALLGLALDGRPEDTAEGQEVEATVPPAVLAAWTAALHAAQPRASRLQAEASRVLTSVGLPHSAEHVTAEGLLVDAWISQDAARAAAAGAGHSPAVWDAFPRGIAITLNGPLQHCAAVPGFNAGHGEVVSQGGLDVELPGMVEPVAARRVWADLRDLEDSLRNGLGEGGRRAARGAEDEGELTASGIPFADLAALSRALAPALRTARKARWLRALGFKPVSLSFVEWEGALSTQERAELLSAAGVPVGKQFL
jgi:hypothetical protein